MTRRDFMNALSHLESLAVERFNVHQVELEHLLLKGLIECIASEPDVPPKRSTSGPSE